MAGSALLLASTHPVQARVGLWVAALAGFGLAAYPGRRHSLHVGATVVLSVLALVWMFGATLVWGTARSTQLRLPALAANGGLGWEWTALLILAVVGVASMGLALRYFTLARPRLGWPLTASAVACFGLWSLGVAYPVTAAVLAGAAGLAGLTLASGERLTTPGLTPAGGQHLITREPAHPPTPKTSQALGIVLLLAALFVGGGWVLETLTWLVVGPEAGYTACNCWAADYNDWQYVAQFFISLAGAIGLVVTAIVYLLRWRWAVVVSAAASTALGCAWLAFLATS